MPIAIFPALFFTVAMLVTTAYFVMGGLPLLVLDHDTALDAKFVRGFFNIYYKSAFVSAAGASLSFLWLGKASFSLGAAAVALLVIVLRKYLIPLMDQLGSRIQSEGAAAIDRFRKLHCAALLVNFLQLVVLVWALTKLSL